MSAQKHNGSFAAKQALRLRVARQLPDTARVFEGFAGEGRIYRGCWARFQGACIDIKAEKAASAARERPHWACYQADTAKALAAGLCATPWDVVDLDAFGEPWSFVHAWLMSRRPFAEVTHVLLTDGYMRQRNLAGPCKALFPEVPKGERLTMTEDFYLERVQQRLDAWGAEAGLVFGTMETTRSRNMRLHYVVATRRSEPARQADASRRLG